MKIQDFNQTRSDLNRSGYSRGPVGYRAKGRSDLEGNTHNQTLEIITATLAFLLPAILLFLIAAK